MSTPTADDELVVTPMQRRHLPAVLEIERQVHPRPWSERIFQSELAQPNRCYLIARRGTVVVGYAGLLLIVDDGHVANVSVDPRWQRRGVATRLMVALCRAGIERGARQLTLEVRMSNRGAQELYRRFGFAPGGLRRAYYPDNREDALVMWAHDIDLPAYAERLDELEATTGSSHGAGAPRRSGDDGTTAVPTHPAAGRMGGR